MDSCESLLVAGPSFGETLEGTRGLAEHGGRRDRAERGTKGGGSKRQARAMGWLGRRRLRRSGRYLGDLGPKIKTFMGRNSGGGRVTGCSPVLGLVSGRKVDLGGPTLGYESPLANF